MSSGKDFEKSLGMVNLLVLELDQDLLSCREKVSNWVTLIETEEEKGDDKFCKTELHRIGRQIYDRGLHKAQQSLLNEAKEHGKIYYEQ